MKCAQQPKWTRFKKINTRSYLREFNFLFVLILQFSSRPSRIWCVRFLFSTLIPVTWKRRPVLGSGCRRDCSGENIIYCHALPRSDTRPMIALVKSHKLVNVQLNATLKSQKKSNVHYWHTNTLPVDRCRKRTHKHENNRISAQNCNHTEKAQKSTCDTQPTKQGGGGELTFV
jgi:hypothetical protein